MEIQWLDYTIAANEFCTWDTDCFLWATDRHSHGDRYEGRAMSARGLMNSREAIRFSGTIQNINQRNRLNEYYHKDYLRLEILLDKQDKIHQGTCWCRWVWTRAVVEFAARMLLGGDDIHPTSPAYVWTYMSGCPSVYDGCIHARTVSNKPGTAVNHHTTFHQSWRFVVRVAWLQ